MNPAFMLVANADRVHDVFAALAASTDSRSRSRLAKHLPWSPARTFETSSGTLGLGVRGWHGYASDAHNDHSFSLSIRGDNVPCDLSLYVGQRYALFELRAATNDAARSFVDESFRAKSRFISGLADSAEGIWYDNEEDPWRVLHPQDHVTKIECSCADVEEHMIVIREPSLMEAFDVDPLGELLVWVLKPEGELTTSRA